MKKDLKIDSNSQIVYSWNSGESGQLTVEYSGLQNSFYMDENGNKINISKIVATYIPDASDTKHGLIIFSDPTDGFGYLNTTGANVNYKFYNQANQQIDFKNNTAWLAVTSLNSNITNTETAKIINGGKAYGLAGSSIKAHDDGSLYADNHNDGPDGTWDFQAHDGQSWDNKGINEYYGAGLISLQNSDFTVRYALLKNQTKESGNGPWVTPTTIIPETPTPRSQIHYHYDTPSTFSLLYFRLLVNNNL